MGMSQSDHEVEWSIVTNERVKSSWKRQDKATKQKIMGKLFFFWTVARADVSKSRVDVSYWRSRVAGTDVGQVAGTEQARGSRCKILPKIAPARGWSDGAQTLGYGRYGAEDFARGGGEMNGAARTAVGGRTCGKVVHLTGAWRRVRFFLTSIFLWMRERVPTIRTIDGILWIEASVNDNRGREIRLRDGYRLWGNFW